MASTESRLEVLHLPDPGGSFLQTQKVEKASQAGCPSGGQLAEEESQETSGILSGHSFLSKEHLLFKQLLQDRQGQAK